MVIDVRRAAAPKVSMLLAGLAAALALRVWLGGGAPAASPPAAIAFSVVLLAAAAWAGARFNRIPWAGVAVGGCGALALVALSFVGLPSVHVGSRASGSALLWWVPLVTVVAAAEELVLRGVLFDAVRSHSGDVVAVAVTAVLFAAIHLPLYGVPALAIDLSAGVFLGCLRVASGGVTAPLVAHVLADVASAWVG